VGAEVTEIEPAGDAALVPATTPADFQVSPETLEMIARSDADNTVTAYTKDWAKFEAWCADRGRTPLPATAQTFAEYVRYLTETPTTRGTPPRPSTIDRAMGTIGRRHSDAGYPLDRRAAAKVYKTYKRDWAKAGNRKTKSTPAVVDAVKVMVDTCDVGTLTGIRDRAVILLGFAIMARRSELAELDIGDITEHTEGIEVLIRVSKTDQEGKGITLAVPYLENPLTCPVVAVQAWLAALQRRGVTSGPLFRRIDRHGHLGGTDDAAGRGGARMTGQSIGTIVRRAATKAGLPNPDSYTGHSLRAGGATSAFEAGAPSSAVTGQGRWSEKSPTVQGYNRAVDRWKNNPMKGIGL
jgi:site-specific recombinase XerD